MGPTDDLPVPPDRELPPTVRERLRSTVVSGLDNRARRPSVRGPLAAAAGVVLLTTAGMVVARWPHGPVLSAATLTSAAPTSTAADPCVTRGAPASSAGNWRYGAADDDIAVRYDNAAAALCVHGDFRYLGRLPTVDDTPVRPAYRTRNGVGLLVVGLVAPDVERLEFTSPVGTSDATIVGPTFAARVHVDADDSGRDVCVTAVDRSGRQIFRGSLAAG
jgi:hypothetical protein